MGASAALCGYMPQGKSLPEGPPARKAGLIRGGENAVSRFGRRIWATVDTTENKIDNSTAPCYPSEAVVQERSLRCAGRGATIHRDPL